MTTGSKQAPLAAIEIDGTPVGRDAPPYVIAELSGNHGGSLERALELVDLAAGTGASAVKLQTYTADTLTIDSDSTDFVIEGGLWHGRTLHDLYREAHTPWDWHKALFDRGRERGVTVLSSPFDDTAVELLEGLGCPAYKIASFELVHSELIECVARTGKPMIMSTGMADADEIGEAIETARTAGATQLIVLHCISGYPTPPGESFLRVIPDIADRFGVLSGLSDHTLTTTTAVAAVALGAVLIEKHFTRSRDDGGPDAAFSLEPDEFRRLCKETRLAWQALGTASYDRRPSEQASLTFRRSVYAVADIAAGEPLTRDNVRVIRPGFGLHPREFGDVLGRRAKADIARGTALSWDLIEHD